MLKHVFLFAACMAFVFAMAWIDGDLLYRKSASNIRETENKITQAGKHATGDTLIRDINFWNGTLKLQQSHFDLISRQRQMLLILTIAFLIGGLISGLLIRFRLPEFTSVFTAAYLLVSCCTVMFFLHRQNPPDDFLLNMTLTGPFIMLWALEAFMVSDAWRFRQTTFTQVYILASVVLGMILLFTTLFIFAEMHMLKGMQLG